jgi:hypothetical protein
MRRIVNKIIGTAEQVFNAITERFPKKKHSSWLLPQERAMGFPLFALISCSKTATDLASSSVR